jgi:hypothetical protein
MNLIKSIILITFISNSLFSYDNWKNEINIYKLNNQNLSIETKKYFCEHKNKKELQKEIFLFLKEQDLNFYVNHSLTIDYLPRKLIDSTLKKNQNCGNPRKNIIIGSCGNWVCLDGSKPNVILDIR